MLEVRRLIRQRLSMVLLVLTPLVATVLLGWTVGREGVVVQKVAVSPAAAAALEADWAALGLVVVDAGAPVSVDVDGVDLVVHQRGDPRRSAAVMARLEPVLGDWERRVRAPAWAGVGVEVGPEARWALAVVDHSVSAADGTARLVAPMWVFLVLSGGLYVALELFAVDRERGLLEALLATRVDRRTVVDAKTVAVAGVSGLVVLLSAGVWGLLRGWSVWTYPGVAVLLVPLVAQSTGGLVALCGWVSSSRVGRALGMPVMLVGAGLAVVAGLPGVELNAVWAVVPVVGLSLALEAMVGTGLDAGIGVWVVGVAALQGVGAVMGARWLLLREGVLLGG